jgi:hypothetical protein
MIRIDTQFFECFINFMLALSQFPAQPLLRGSGTRCSANAAIIFETEITNASLTPTRDMADKNIELAGRHCKGWGNRTGDSRWVQNAPAFEIHELCLTQCSCCVVSNTGHVPGRTTL